MNVGWRYESARHALAAQGVKTGRRYNFSPEAWNYVRSGNEDWLAKMRGERRYNFDQSAFQEGLRGLGFGRTFVRPEMMQRYTEALGPARDLATVAAPVSTSVSLATASIPEVVRVPVVTQVATRVGRNTVMTPVTTYKEVQIPASMWTKVRRVPVDKPVKILPIDTTQLNAPVRRVISPKEFWSGMRGRVGAQVITPVRLPTGEVVNASDALAAQKLMYQYPGAVIVR